MIACSPQRRKQHYRLELPSGKKLRSIDTGNEIAALVWDANANLLATGHYGKTFEVRTPLETCVCVVKAWFRYGMRPPANACARFAGGDGLSSLSASPPMVGCSPQAFPSYRQTSVRDTSTGRELATVSAHPESEEDRRHREDTLAIRLALGGVCSLAFSPDARPPRLGRRRWYGSHLGSRLGERTLPLRWPRP